MPLKGLPAGPAPQCSPAARPSRGPAVRCRVAHPPVSSAWLSSAAVLDLESAHCGSLVFNVLRVPVLHTLSVLRCVCPGSQSVVGPFHPRETCAHWSLPVSPHPQPVIWPCLRMSFTRNVLFCDWPLSLRVMFLSFVRHCSFYKYLCTNTHSHLFQVLSMVWLL